MIPVASVAPVALVAPVASVASVAPVRERAIDANDSIEEGVGGGLAWAW